MVQSYRPHISNVNNSEQIYNTKQKDVYLLCRSRKSI